MEGLFFDKVAARAQHFLIEHDLIDGRASIDDILSVEGFEELSRIVAPIVGQAVSVIAPEYYLNDPQGAPQRQENLDDRAIRGFYKGLVIQRFNTDEGETIERESILCHTISMGTSSEQQGYDVVTREIRVLVPVIGTEIDILNRYYLVDRARQTRLVTEAPEIVEEIQLTLDREDWSLVDKIRRLAELLSPTIDLEGSIFAADLCAYLNQLEILDPKIRVIPEYFYEQPTKGDTTLNGGAEVLVLEEVSFDIQQELDLIALRDGKVERVMEALVISGLTVEGRRLIYIPLNQVLEIY